MSAVLAMNYDQCQDLTSTGPAVERALNQVASLDFSMLKTKMAQEKGWSDERLREVEGLYRQFLALNIAYPERKVCPTGPIDEFWHAHILDTAAYAKDCDYLFGRPLEHFPYFGMRGPEDNEALQTAFRDSRDLFIIHFGVDPTIGSMQARGCSPQRCP